MGKIIRLTDNNQRLLGFFGDNPNKAIEKLLNTADTVGFNPRQIKELEALIDTHLKAFWIEAFAAIKEHTAAAVQSEIYKLKTGY